jgi:hypothetical protein
MLLDDFDSRRDAVQFYWFGAPTRLTGWRLLKFPPPGKIADAGQALRETTPRLT